MTRYLARPPLSWETHLPAFSRKCQLVLLSEYNIPEKITQLETWMREALAPCTHLETSKEIRCLGE